MGIMNLYAQNCCVIGSNSSSVCQLPFIVFLSAACHTDTHAVAHMRTWHLTSIPVRYDDDTGEMTQAS